jgi:hypothetical protein
MEVEAVTEVTPAIVAKVAEPMPKNDQPSKVPSQYTDYRYLTTSLSHRPLEQHRRGQHHH